MKEERKIFLEEKKRLVKLYQKMESQFIYNCVIVSQWFEIGGYKFEANSIV